MKCPFCIEEIQDSAIKCRFCGEVLNQDAFDQARAHLGVRSRPQTKDRTILLRRLALVAIGAALIYAFYPGLHCTVTNDASVLAIQESREDVLPDQGAPTRTNPTPPTYAENPIATSNLQAKLSAAQRANAEAPVPPPGDPPMAKPEQTPTKAASQASAPRPRTIKEAMARRNLQSLPGNNTNQNGEVKRRLELCSFDAKATPFGAYDAAMVEVISQRWYALLDERSYTNATPGKVVLKYRLHSDGKITDLEVAVNTVSDQLSLVAQKAVTDPAPYAAWSAEMRGTCGEVRTLQFTFYYY